MDLLFTADENYAIRIPVVLKSVQACHPGLKVGVHLICDGIPDTLEEDLRDFCNKLGYSFSLYLVPQDLFHEAPVNKHYSKAMYYRMLAGEILPASMNRVLYIDPDILVVNSLLPLWNTDLGGCVFAAASHTPEEGLVDNINRFRLDTSSVYFNTGVLLMDLNKCRSLVRKEDIFRFIETYEYKLLLPDQDVFNALYGHMTKWVPDEVWNLDARKCPQYRLRSSGLVNEYWIIRHTSIIHYCGKEKPWNRNYRYAFGELYRHYEHLCELDGWTPGPEPVPEV